MTVSKDLFDLVGLVSLESSLDLTTVLSDLLVELSFSLDSKMAGGLTFDISANFSSLRGYRMDFDFDKVKLLIRLINFKLLAVQPLVPNLGKSVNDKSGFDKVMARSNWNGFVNSPVGV